MIDKTKRNKNPSTELSYAKLLPPTKLRKRLENNSKRKYRGRIKDYWIVQRWVCLKQRGACFATNIVTARLPSQEKNSSEPE